MIELENVFSVFDGMSCGRIALERAGINVENYYSSEIKNFAINVANDNYPQDAQNRLGNIEDIQAKDLPKIDLFIGGSPCQDFSGANKERLGVKGSKSKLFFEYVRLLEATKPKYFLLENVRMKKEHQNFISSVMGCEPIVIQSSLVSPQLRHRLYWTNIPNITQPKDKGILLQDILEKGYTDRKKARALLISDVNQVNRVKQAHRYFNIGFTSIIFEDEQHYKAVKEHFDKHFKGYSAKQIDKLIVGMDLSIYDGIRHMTPNEQEQCQTVPIGYTKILNKKQTINVLADGWTVDVIAHIFSHIK